MEHSDFLRNNSDWVIKMGPRAGSYGGEVMYVGKPIKEQESLKKGSRSRPSYEKGLRIEKAELPHGQLVDLDLPLGQITIITGKSGSGKKTLAIGGAYNHLVGHLRGNNYGEALTCPLKSFYINDKITNAILFEGAHHQYSSRSTVGTYLGLTPQVRKHYSELSEAKEMGLEKGHFSPNSPLGKCDACEGTGIKQVDMVFMEDISFTCPECEGMKIRPYVARIADKGVSFHQATHDSIDKLIDYFL